MTNYDEFTLTIDENDHCTAVWTRLPPAGPRSNEGHIPDRDSPGHLRKHIELAIEDLKSGAFEGKGEHLLLLGEDLYEALFPGKIASLFEDALLDVKSRPGSTLRVIIDVAKESTAYNWPLEFLRCPADAGCWLAGGLNAPIALSRRIHYMHDRVNRDPNLPLDVLIVVSRPSDIEERAMAAPVIDQIRKLVTALGGAAEMQAAGQARMHIKVLGELDKWEHQLKDVEIINERATFDRIARLVEESEDWRPQLFHFIGHGQFHPSHGGEIGLVDERNAAMWCNAEEFCELFKNCTFRVVLLQACETAKAESAPHFMSVAARLAEHNIPAVVAMQFGITNDYATIFAIGFYEALRQGKDIDQAVETGRSKLTSKTLWRHRDFGAPVLFQYDTRGYVQASLSPRFPVGAVPRTSISLPREAPTSQYSPLDRLLHTLEHTRTYVEHTDYDAAQSRLNPDRGILNALRPDLVYKLDDIIDMLQICTDPVTIVRFIDGLCSDLKGAALSKSTAEMYEKTVQTPPARFSKTKEGSNFMASVLPAQPNNTSQS